MMNGDTHQATHSFVDLVDILKGKLRCLAENFKDVNEMVSPVVRMRIAVLRDIQRQHDELKAKFLEERAALEARYQRLYEPLYIERYEIVNGLVEVESAEDESTNGTPADDKAIEEKGVPGFWLTAMKTHEVVYKEIRDPDEEALKYLKDIKWRRTDDFKSFKLEFLFNPNPFFRNTVLTKSYFMASVDEPILETAIGTDIKWFPRKCLTQKILKKRLKMGSQNGKPLTKTEVCESFFNFFYPPHIPDDDEKIEEYYAKELQSKMEADYDIGCTIRDKIIPNAVSWFTGEALHGDGPKLKYTVIDEDAGQDNEADDEDEEYENEYSDDDEDGDEQYKAKKRIHL